MSNIPSESLDGLVLTLEDKPPRLAQSLAQIHSAVDALTPRGGPGFVILEGPSDDFAQAAGGDGAYTVEWREHSGKRFTHWVAGRTGQPSSRTIMIPTNDARVTVRENERLDSADVKVILTAFAEQNGRPVQYAWRDITKQFLPDTMRSPLGMLKSLIARFVPASALSRSSPVDMAGSAYANLSLPFPAVVVPGEHALTTRLRLLAPGVTPLVMGVRADVEWLELIVEITEHSAEATLEAAAALDVDGWIADTLNEWATDIPLPSGEWPSGDVRPMSLGAHLDGPTRLPRPMVIIGLIPTPEPWQTPAFTAFGEWNDCPPSHVHVAMHKRWHERFGSDIVTIAGDVVECTVARPPTTREEALALATEQYAYCMDIVEQGFQSIEALAASLMKSAVWSFWWD